jgi:carboxypeptidase family protein
MAHQFKSRLSCFAFAIVVCTLPSFGQSSQPTPLPAGQQLSGTISGTVVDGTGAVVAGARVRLTREDQSPAQEVLAGADGEFSFANIAPGPFKITVTSATFATQSSSGILHSGEFYIAPPIVLTVATTNTVVDVTPSTQAQIAEAQIKEQEKQRVLSFIPNFYVSYVPNAVPLNSRQKFQLAWKTTLDPVTFAVSGIFAGIEQAQNTFPGYGQGAQGYGKRYGASLADSVAGTFIASAILPSLFRQDPRYFYKGTGSKRSRLLYAMGSAVICKGDNGHMQPNYSNILGNLAAGGISNLYYPAKDRNGATLTFENGLIGIGSTAVANVLQEFVVRKFTPHVHHQDPAKP